MLVAHNPACSIEEAYTLGKFRDPLGGGDRLILGPRFFGVVDAATEKYGHSWTIDGTSMSGEAAMATVLARNLSKSTAELWQVLSHAQSELQEAALMSGIDLRKPGASPLASLVIYDSKARFLYHLGDCSFGFVLPHGFMPLYHERLVDRLAATRRAQIIKAFAEKGTLPVGVDPGREAIMEDLRAAVTLANANPLAYSPHDTLHGVPKRDLVYPVFDAISPLAPALISLPADLKSLVLSSDGYPKLFPSLRDSEEYLDTSLRLDPMRIGDHASTKGIAPGAVSFDDRSYLKISV
jgi:hypothetical protein